MTTQELLRRAQAAKPAIVLADTGRKNEALLAMAGALEESTDAILEANARDLEAARGTVSEVMLDRLALSPDRIQGMAAGIREVVALPDPVGQVLRRVERPNGLVIEKTSVPMGVIAIIYESRPNVTSDAAALALKAGSACVLRGGKEAHRSAAAIVKALRVGLGRAGLPEDAVQLVEDTTRQSANELMTARGLVDLLIPRGGPGLIRACVENGYRHMPHLRGPGRRPGYGLGHHGERQVQPPQRVQRRRGLLGSPGRRPRLSARPAPPPGRGPGPGRPAPGGAAAGPGRGGRHPRRSRRAPGFRHGVSGLYLGGAGGGQPGGGRGPYRRPLHRALRVHHHGR